MVIFMNDPKRTVIDLSVPIGMCEQLAAYMKDLGLHYGAAADHYGAASYEDRLFFLDIQGSPLKISVLLKSLEENEWETPDKIYILIKARKGGKAHERGAETRRKAGKGSQGGNSERADSPAGHGATD